VLHLDSDGALDCWDYLAHLGIYFDCDLVSRIFSTGQSRVAVASVFVGVPGLHDADRAEQVRGLRGIEFEYFEDVGSGASTAGDGFDVCV
jgi:hypothetical protein